MKRVLLTSALVLGLAACGGSRDEAAAPSDSASPAASTSAAPTASASPSTPAAARECPVKAVPAAVPTGVSSDLAVKPVVAASTAPPPTDVTVADVVVGTGDEATTLSPVEVKYVGSLYTTGVEFDSSWKTSPETTIPFTVCSTETVPGFSIGPTGMKVGGRRVVTIPPTYGYQDQEQGSIPAGSTLVFVIDLVKVSPPA